MARPIRNSSRNATAKASRLRKGMGQTEQALWHALRREELGFRFRRQVPVGPYVLDFFSHQARLCVEVDGEHHVQRRTQDAARDEWLMSAHSIRTLRFRTIDIIENLDAVREMIYRACCEGTRRNPLERLL